MEERKQTEINYYDDKAEEWLKSENKDLKGDFEGFNPFLLSSYNFLPSYLEKKCSGKKLLDYGCGNGVHCFWLEKLGAEVTAVDLSEKSLDIAKERQKKLYQGSKIIFQAMDCENLSFANSAFDIVFDGGSFSSLDLKKAFSEIVRVLKPNGFLIGIETFGHNPLTNLNRQINKLTGKRTGWAASHIFSLKDIELAKQFFGKVQVHYFHVISWAALPFLKFGFGKPLLKFLETADRILLKVPFLRKYSFKVVFVMEGPKK